MLVVTKGVIATVYDTEVARAVLIGRMFLVAKRIAREDGIAESGYRLVMNTNADGGQTVFHIHLHVIGGRTMEWPPG